MNSFVYSNCYFGSHISFKGTLTDTLQLALENRMYSIQFFLGNRLRLNRTTLSEEDICSANKILNIWDIHTFTHIPYSVNFAGKGGILSSSGNEEVSSYVDTCVQSVQHELSTLDKLNASKKGCVIHIGSIGSHPDRKKGLDCVVQSINKLVIPESTPLCLETMVGRGGVLGTTMEELKYIMDRTTHPKGRIKLCIDTCHLYAEGLYDLGKEIEIDRCFHDIESLFGDMSVLQCIHFNDSECEFKSKQDRHARIGQGYIFKAQGKPMNQSVHYLLQMCERYKIPTILETTSEDYDNVLQNITYF